MPNPAGGAVLLALIVLAVVVSGRPGVAATDAGTVRYERAEAQTIKAHTREILADPQFAPRQTFWQWLRGKLGRWEGPKLNLPHGVGTFLLWAVMIWCILALLAILIDLLWTVWVLARPTTSGGRASPAGGSRLYERLSFEQLRQKAQELAQQGAYREATGVLLLALLRRLETASVLRFHASKTNGDYLREYPGDLAGRPQFVQFVAAFERSVYGGLEVSRPTYETMNSLAERILDDVGPEPQI